MIHALKCPTCSAPLDYDDERDGPTCVCPFCANTVVVPDALRRNRGQQVVSTVTYQSGRPRRSGSAGTAIAVVGVLIALVVGIIIALGAFIADRASRIETVNVNPPPRTTLIPPVPPILPSAPTKPAFAGAVLEFGGEGIGPGLFKDARNVASDGEGNIYAADYTGGRVQVFDPQGRFITQWMADARMPLRALAADRKGTVYIVQSGRITRYEGKTGTPLGKVSYAGGDGFDDVIVTADGGLLAVYDRNTDDIVRFDSSGRTTRVIKKAISGQTDRSELNMRVAVDGLGNIYALGTFNEAVLKFTPEGRFVNKFGGSGEGAGQFRAAHAIAVDGQGRVYVSDFKGVQVFDGEGRYLDIFKPAPSAFGLSFNYDGELLVAARTKILKCLVPKP